ncbi:Uncharacterised protein [Mycobacteroides abscessus subsp. massiliense]|nr:Uncharacterised protein [Mycobacteroides abscessus subsp. massiliense]
MATLFGAVLHPSINALLPAFPLIQPHLADPLIPVPTSNVTMLEALQPSLVIPNNRVAVAGLLFDLTHAVTSIPDGSCVALVARCFHHRC